MLKKNFFFQSISLFLSYFLSFFITMYLTRTLHPTVMGQVGFVEASMGYFALLAGLGIPIYAMRKTSEYREDKHKLSVFVKEILLIGVICSVISMGICVGLTFGVGRFKEDRVLFQIFMWQILLGSFTFEWLYKGTENFKKLALRNIFVKAVSLILIVLLVKSEADVWTYAGIVVGTSCLTALINFTGIKGLVDWSVRVKLKSAFGHFKGIIIFFLMSCAVTIYANMDIFMLGFMTDNSSVAYYNVASKIKTLLTAVGGVLWGIALPKATSYWHKNNVDKFVLLGRRTIGYILWLQIPVSVFSVIVAEYLIMLVGGGEYLAGATALRCLIASFIPIAISNIIGGQILIPSGKENRLFVAEILGAVVNLVLNFFFIAWWGIVGAAVSTVIAEMVVTAYVMWVVKFEMNISLFSAGSILRQSVSALISGVAVWGLVRSHVFGEIPFVVLVLSAVSFLVLDLGVLVIIRDEFTCNEVWNMMKSCLMSMVRWTNRRKLVVRKDVKCEGETLGLKYCPCCESFVKAMVYNNYHWYPKDFNPRLYLPEKRRTECPNCGSFSRHRLLMWYFLEHSEELKTVNNFLYFACEKHIQGWLDDNGIKYTTADLFAPADLQINIEDTGLPKNTYEYIVCNHVLEHVSDFMRALREVYRILAPNGIFICSFPIMDSMETYVEADSDDLSEAKKIEKFGQWDHLRIFGKDSKAILESVGFEVEMYDRSRCPEYIVPEDGPAVYDKALLFICRK